MKTGDKEIVKQQIVGDYNGTEIRNRLQFYSEIRQALDIFDIIDYSVITGGFVQNSKKLGDVDIITVLPYVNDNSRVRIFEFSERHVRAQLNNEFSPDFQFPTDVVSRQQIIDAVNGRALSVFDNDLKLKEYSIEDIAINSEADYRIWLYEMITHDFDLVSGSFELLVQDTSIALKTILLYTANLFHYKMDVPMEQVRRDMFSSANLPYTLSEKQCRYLLIMLERECLGKMDNGGVLWLNIDGIKKETKKLKNAIITGSIATAVHILEWGVLREAMKEWDTLGRAGHVKQ